jgi:hypothetical protein
LSSGADFRDKRRPTALFGVDKTPGQQARRPATAVDTSKHAVNEVSTGRVRPDGGVGQKRTDAQKATDAVAAAIRGLERVRDKIADVSGADMAKLEIALGETGAAMKMRPPS